MRHNSKFQKCFLRLKIENKKIGILLGVTLAFFSVYAPKNIFEFSGYNDVNLPSKDTKYDLKPSLLLHNLIEHSENACVK